MSPSPVRQGLVRPSRVVFVLIARAAGPDLKHNLRLVASAVEIQGSVVGRQGGADWTSGNVVGSSRTHTGRSFNIERIRESDVDPV